MNTLKISQLPIGTQLQSNTANNIFPVTDLTVGSF